MIFFFKWDLICDRESLAGTITSIQMAGVLCGAVMTGQLADLFGRRHILFIEHTILVTMWFCSAFAGTWMIYAVLRFVIGALIGGMYFSRTPDQDFHCFYHSISHTCTSPWEIKTNSHTSTARWPQVHP